MIWAIIKDAIYSCFDFNFVYVGIIAFLIFWIIYLYRQKNATKKELLYISILAVYIAVLVGCTLLNRKIGSEIRKELTLFWSYREYLAEKNPSFFMQMIYNIAVFIPWPILFTLVFPKMKKFLWGVGSAFLFSVFIEITQLVFKLGMFEFDDMFHNTLGAVIGYAILTLVRAIILKYRSQKSN